MRIKQVKVIKSIPMNRILIIAYNWRVQHGGVIPRTIEEHFRNIDAYCMYAKHLN